MSEETKAPTRIVLEMGAGTALHSGDYTKAAKRAVQDALYHSSIVLFRSLKIDPNAMRIELILGAQQPDKIDLEAVAALLPYGQVTPRAVHGGLDAIDASSGTPCVTVNAAIVVRLPL
ncbi:MAG: Lin0512 family protein [Rhodospirillales bacterium]